MQAVACVVGSQLASSFLCTSRFSPRSLAQPNSLVQCHRIGLLSCPVGRSSKTVFATSDWSSSKASPARGVVSDEIEGIPVGEYGERYLVPNHMEDDDDGLGDVRVECDANGCIIVMNESKTLAEEDIGAGHLRCDLSGCYFTLDAPAAKSFEVIEGEGWRLGYETAPESEGSFCAIVGAGGWSIALTGGEFNDFCSLIQISSYERSLVATFLSKGIPALLQTIRKGIMSMDEDEITARDEIVLQVEKGSIWMECTIPKNRVGALQLLWQPGVPKNLIDTQLKQAFEVRFILSGGATKRQAEGYWPADAVMDMLQKIDLSSFNQPRAPYAESVARRAAAKV